MKDSNHIYNLIDRILIEKRPNWGYVEKSFFVEDLINDFGYLLETDEDIIEKVIEILDDNK